MLFPARRTWFGLNCTQSCLRHTCAFSGPSPLWLPSLSGMSCRTLCRCWMLKVGRGGSEQITHRRDFQVLFPARRTWFGLNCTQSCLRHTCAFSGPSPLWLPSLSGMSCRTLCRCWMLEVGRGGSEQITHRRDESFLEFVLLRTALE